MKTIKLSKTFECSPIEVGPVKFEAGCYAVPRDMPELVARRAVRAGVGVYIEDAPAPVKRTPRRKARMAAPENKAINGSYDPPGLD